MADQSNLASSSPTTTNPGNTDQGTAPETPPTPPPVQEKFEPLAWESASKPFRKDWSDYLFGIVRNELPKLDKVQDATTFCRPYFQLTEMQKINFWGQLISAMSYYESGWSPVSRMQETTMGTDPVTKLPVYSEGLLQLSYQDIQWAPFCRFEWSKDKNLSPSDPKKTILDPFINLECGTKILANQILKYNKIVLSSGVYWAVIKANGKYEKIDEIALLVRKLTFCQ